MALNTDQLFLDIHSEYEDKIESYHVNRKTFNWERDGPGSGLNLADLEVSFDRFATLMHHAVLDRSVIGAPANVDPPSIEFKDDGVAKVAPDPGEWVRQQGRKFEYQWLRDGTQPIWGATEPVYETLPADAGWDLVCEVSAVNNQVTTQEPTPPVRVAGSPPENITAAQLRRRSAPMATM